MVEILKPRYGCTVGQRLRVIDDAKLSWRLTHSIEIPKNQRDKTWCFLTEAEAAETSRKVRAATAVALAIAAPAREIMRGPSIKPCQGLQSAAITRPASPARDSWRTPDYEEHSRLLIDQLIALPDGQKPQALDKVTGQLKRLPVEYIRLMVRLLDENTQSSNGQPAPSSSGPVTQRTRRSPSPLLTTQPQVRRRSPTPRSPTPDSPVSKVKAEQKSARPREAGALGRSSSRERTASVTRVSKEEQVPSPGRAARASDFVPHASGSVPQGISQNRSAGGGGRDTRRPELVGLSPGRPVIQRTLARVSEDARRPLIESAVRQSTDSRIREGARWPVIESAVRQPTNSRIPQESGAVRERSRSKDYNPPRTNPLAHADPLARELREFSQAQKEKEKLEHAQKQLAHAKQQREAQRLERKERKEPKPLAASLQTPTPVRACSAPGRMSPGFATGTPVAPYSESPDRREASRERTRQNHSQCGRAAGQPLAPWRGYVGQPAV